MGGKLTIFNMALGFIGTRMLASLNERTPEAAQCNLYWDLARKSALRDFPWPFCQKRIRLAPVDMPEAYAGEYGKAYAMPLNVIKVNRVNDHAAFEIGEDKGSLLIFCDEEEAVACCTCDVENAALMDGLFVTALAYRLAMLIAVPLLKNNPYKVRELAQLYQAALPQAGAQAASEGRRARNTEDDWVLAREDW